MGGLCLPSVQYDGAIVENRQKDANRSVLNGSLFQLRFDCMQSRKHLYEDVFLGSGRWYISIRMF